MRGAVNRLVALIALAALLSAGPLVRGAHAEEPDAGASWHLEQPLPPELPNGDTSATPIGLGKIGDLEFWAPNRGLLITAGNPPSIPPGIWAYNGVGWHELATVCGATDGRIAWAGPDEFWTISDGRPGQQELEAKPPLEDNTLCHFANGEVAGSYASLAFLPSSYQAMHGAACAGPEDCWFGGEPLPDGQVGSFHLHWDGHALNAEPNLQGHAVEDMHRVGNEIYESVRLLSGDLLGEEEPSAEPSDLHLLEPTGVQPRFLSLFPGAPIYSEGEFPEALDFLHLSSGASALWGAANPASPAPTGSAPAQVTVLRILGPTASQIIGPTTDPEGSNPFTKELGSEGSGSRNETISSISAEPPGEAEGEGSAAGESAWLALNSGPNESVEPDAPALVARLSDTGVISERVQLPSAQEVAGGIGPKGAADKIACPAPHDCWLATQKGWLYHLSTPAGRAVEEADPDTDPAFSKAQPINFRPKDSGIPSIPPDSPPVDDSGLLGELPASAPRLAEVASPQSELRVPVPLVSRIHTRLRHGTTLELSFHLAVRAKVRLLAKRRAKIVARTPMHTFPAGNRALKLQLDRRRWPTRLDLQTHALAKLPTVSTRGAATTTVSTGFAELTRLPLLTDLGPFG